MDFSNASWIGKRAGECPAFEAGGEKEKFVSLQLEKMKSGLQDTASLLGRRKFLVNKPIASAVCHVVGLGFFELYVNGKTVGDRRLTPGYGEFITRIPYYSLDVTGYLQTGSNVLAFELGDGWFLANPRFNDWRTVFYGNKRILLRLVIRYADGSEDEIVSDDHFRLHDGAVTLSTIYDGEEYDANLEIPGWKLPDFDDSGWQKAVLVEHPGGTLTRDDTPPIRVVGQYMPEKIFEADPQRFIYSFQKNLTGNLLVLVSGKKGDRVTLRFAENLNEDGTLDSKTNNNAYNTDRYVLKGDGVETIDPRFTYHCFRYAEIRLSDPDTKIFAVFQQNIRSDLPVIGSFESGDGIFNRLHDVFLRSQANCLVGIPVDCPQRDERLGWLGDANVTAETVLYNYDVHSFYRKYIQLIADSQRDDGGISEIAPWPYTGHAFDWAMAFPYLIHYCYKFEGEPDLIQNYFNNLMKFRSYVLSRSDGYHIMKVRYGDWYSSREDWKRGGPEHLEMYLYILLMDMLTDMAKTLSKEDVLPELIQDREEVAKILLEEDYDAQRNLFCQDCACINAFAVLTHLLPAEKEKALVDHIIEEIETHNNCLFAGVFGVKAVFEVLELYERQDIMDKILHATDYPGYLDLLKGDKSTLPEKWNGAGSGCHAMFDSPDSYFYTSFAGIRINRFNDTPILIKPWLNEKTGSVHAKLKIREGEIRSDWVKTEKGYDLSVFVPVSNAVFHLHPSLKGYKVLVNGSSKTDEFILDPGESYIEIRK